MRLTKLVIILISVLFMNIPIVADETEPTELEAIRFKIQLCQDSVYQYYLSRTGIQLHFSVTLGFPGDEPITGVAESSDERFVGPVSFKCIYGELMGVEGVLTDIEIEGIE